MRRVLIAITAWFAWAGTATAEPRSADLLAQYHDPNAPPPPRPQYEQQEQQPPRAYDPYGAPVLYDQYGRPVQPYPPQPTRPPVARTPEAGRGFQYGASLFVPIWLGDVNDQVSPGIGFNGRIGWEVGGGLSLEGGIGWMFNSDDVGFYYEAALTNFFFTAGARYGVLNPSAVVPFVQAAFQLNLFESCYEDRYGFYYCAGYGSDVAVGFNAGGGLVVEIGPYAGLDLGVNVTGTTEVDVLDVDPTESDFLFYLSPFLGFTLYY